MVRSVRLFVSSTFRDFVAERSALQSCLRPALEHAAHDRGLRLHMLDLRWGISREAAHRHGVMDTCITEVRRCRDLGVGPFLLGLLGDRCGWRPAPSSLSKVDMESVLEALTGGKDRDEVARAYRLDENAIPGQWIFRPGVVSPRTLRALLDEACGGGTLDAELCTRVQASMTERELLEALACPGAERRVLVFQRKILPSRQWEDDPVGKARHLALLDRLSDGLCPLETLETRWVDGAPEQRYLDDLVERIQGAVVRCLDHAEVPPTTSEAERHKVFARERAAVVVGRSEMTEIIRSRAAEGHGVAIIAPAGVGKSSVAARFASDEAQAGRIVICRFVGLTPTSTRLPDLVTGILAESLDSGLEPQIESSADLDAQVEALRRLIATNGLGLTVLIDAVDQLEPSVQWPSASWLPSRVGTGNALVVTCRGDQGEELARAVGARVGRGGIVTLAGLERGALEELLERSLAGRGRRTTEHQSDAVLTALVRGGGSPLCAVLAAARAATWQSWVEPGPLPVRLEHWVDDLLVGLVEVRDHGPMLLRGFVASLLAAREGLTEDELHHALARRGDLLVEQAERTPDAPWPDRLPDTAWVRLRGDFWGYLTERFSPSGPLLTFVHRAVAEALAVVIDAASDAAATHDDLAATIGEIYRGAIDSPLAERHVCEAAYHRLLGSDPDSAVDLLTTLDHVARAARWARVDTLLADLEQAAVEVSAPGSVRLKPWHEFVRTNAYCLRRTSPEWGGDRIAFQLAVERPAGDPIQQEAEAWLREGRVDWTWMRRTRPDGSFFSPESICTGHVWFVVDVARLDERHAVSAARDGSLRLWDVETGRCAGIVARHPDGWNGVLALSRDLVVAWNAAGQICAYDPWTATMRTAYAPLPGPVAGVKLIGHGTLVAWSLEGVVSVYTVGVPAVRARWPAIGDMPVGVFACPGGWVAVIEYGGAVHFLPLDGGEPEVRGAPQDVATTALLLQEETVLAVGFDESSPLWVWDLVARRGRPHALCADTDGGVLDSLRAPSGAAKWSDDVLLLFLPGELQRLHLTSGTIETLGTWVDGLPPDESLRLDERWLLTWSRHGSVLTLWDLAPVPAVRAALGGHGDSVAGVMRWDERRFLTWSWDGSLKLWALPTAGITETAMVKTHFAEVEALVELPDVVVTHAHIEPFLLVTRLSDGATVRCLSPLDGASVEHVARVGQELAVVGRLGGVLCWMDLGLETSRAVSVSHIVDHAVADGDTVALVSGRRLSLQTAAAGEVSAAELHGANIEGLVWLGRGWLATWTETGEEVRLWRTPTLECTDILALPWGENGRILAVDAERFLVAGEERCEVWQLGDVRRRVMVLECPTKGNHPWLTACVASQSRLIGKAHIGDRDTRCSWDLTTGRFEGQWPVSTWRALHPTLASLLAPRSTVAPTDATAWYAEGAVHIDQPAVRWYGPPVHLHVVREDGTVVATSLGGEVVVLKLFRGSARLALAACGRLPGLTTQGGDEPPGPPLPRSRPAAPTRTADASPGLHNGCRRKT